MELTQTRLKEVLHYEPETGVFTWKVQTGSRGVVGSVAGCYNKLGYVQIMVDKKRYYAHRLAFLFMAGEFPGVGLQVDHTNHYRDDNRWKNLRIVTHQDNNKNTSIREDNSSGTVGVSWAKSKKKWRAQIKINGKQTHLGYFDDKNEAIKARNSAEIKYDYHPNHGKVM